MAVADSAGMEHSGRIGVRHGEVGRITRVSFNRNNDDGRAILNSQAWREFHQPLGLDVGRLTLITMRHSDSRRFDMMMVINCCEDDEGAEEGGNDDDEDTDEDVKKD